jgi:PIN domain nuclease of toxin-antitoxin system
MGTIKYLLDTHTFLWVALDDQRISGNVKKAIKSENAKIFVSPVTAYEIMNKFRLGKLPEYTYIAENYLEVFHNLGAIELPINTKHLHFAGRFEWSHRDPFDRILAAQASIDNLTLITTDPIFNDLPWIKILC